jgi:hypothetical protein
MNNREFWFNFLKVRDFRDIRHDIGSNGEAKIMPL